ncbi:hypothetical protein ACFWG6_31030 [Streptomyces erythrochromogenes]|uniref:hypothetical protein n=1 Tax=Streptomyces erythrochromogenes TaxID=285574 RepID=UPI003644C7ED
MTDPAPFEGLASINLTAGADWQPAADYCPLCRSKDVGPTAQARLDAALRQILADANHHDLCATESKTPEGGISHSSIAAGLRIAARHLLAAQKEPTT